MSAATQVYKVKFSTGKGAMFREYLIRHQELAAKAVGERGEGAMHSGVLMQNEILKVLLIEVDGKPFTPTTALDEVLTLREYNEAIKVIKQLSGEGEGVSAPNIEVVSSGGK